MKQNNFKPFYPVDAIVDKLMLDTKEIVDEKMATLFDSIKKTYSILARCRNCGAITDVHIPKGIPIEKYFKEISGKCPECGVNMLERAPVHSTDDDMDKKMSEGTMFKNKS